MVRQASVMVRVREDTRTSLQVLAFLMEEAHSKGKAEYPVDDSGRLSLDSVIRILIDRDWAHKLRSGSKENRALLEESRRSLGMTIRKLMED